MRAAFHCCLARTLIALAAIYLNRSDITPIMFQFQTMNTTKRRRDDDSDSEDERNSKVRTPKTLRRR